MSEGGRIRPGDPAHVRPSWAPACRATSRSGVSMSSCGQSTSPRGPSRSSCGKSMSSCRSSTSHRWTSRSSRRPSTSPSGGSTSRGGECTSPRRSSTSTRGASTSSRRDARSPVGDAKSPRCRSRSHRRDATSRRRASVPSRGGFVLSVGPHASFGGPTTRPAATSSCLAARGFGVDRRRLTPLSSSPLLLVYLSRPPIRMNARMADAIGQTGIHPKWPPRQIYQ